MKNIKVGSIWQEKVYPLNRIRIEYVKGSTVRCTFIKDLTGSLEGTAIAYHKQTFFHYFEPVYMVEGFEV